MSRSIGSRTLSELLFVLGSGANLAVSRPAVVAGFPALFAGMPG